MGEQIDVHMLAEVAVLKTQVKHLTDMLHDQKRILENQDKILSELMAMANRGKGSLYMFMALGGFLGALLSNLKALIGIFNH